MTANRLWMIGCIAFAALSAYLAMDLFGSGMNQYGATVQYPFIEAQRDVLFKLVPEILPRLQADQIVAAAKAANIPISEQTSNAIILTSGIAFDLTGSAVSRIRSTNF